MTWGLFLSGVAGTLMIGYATRNLWREHARLASNGSSIISPQIRETRKLTDISHIWQGEVIKLCDIAYIWKEIDTGKPERYRPKPVFSHKEIDEFFAKYVDKPKLRGNRRIVIEKLLKMLDNGGDCPSIVGRGQYENDKEAERGYAIERYDCYARIPLWKHSIAVAAKYISKFPDKEQVPDALVIALGHDIGMIEAQYVKYYKELTHPEISLLVLKTIPEYVSLVDFDEFNSIINLHHSISNLPLVKILKAADQEVRHTEFAGPTSAGAIENPESVTTQAPTELVEENKETVTANDSEVAAFAAEGDPGDFLGDSGPPGETNQSKYALTEIAPLPHWLDFDAILSHMGKQINMVEKTSDMSLNWTAYSVREGYVWVKEELLLEAVMKTSMENSALFASEVDKAVRWNVLYTVVMEFVRRGAVAKEMVKEGKYLAQVTILTGRGKPIAAFMTPFLSSAFGIMPDELEQRKGSVLNSVIKNIVPLKQESQSC